MTASPRSQHPQDVITQFTLEWLAEVEALADKLRAWLGPDAPPVKPASRVRQVGQQQ